MRTRIKPGSPEHRARIVRQARKLRCEIQQIFDDAASWNKNARKPGQPPIDPDADGKLKRALAGIDFMLACEDASSGVGLIEPMPGEPDDRERH